MGMKPRKRPPPALSKRLANRVRYYSDDVRDILTRLKIPPSKWRACFSDLEDFPKAHADHDLQWLQGWFRGVTDALKCALDDLVEL
jgi:hypothetical protein